MSEKNDKNINNIKDQKEGKNLSKAIKKEDFFKNTVEFLLWLKKQFSQINIKSFFPHFNKKVSLKNTVRKYGSAL